MTLLGFGLDLGALTFLVAVSFFPTPCCCQETWWSRNFPGQPDPTVCPDLFHPANGNVTVSGTKATYSCNTNYSVVGDAWLKCACGQWSNAKGDLANETVCRRDGSWGPWSDYSECTKTCGTGSQIRTRNCTNPPREPGAKDCPGDDQETRHCNEKKCPVCSVQRNIQIGALFITVEPSGSEVRFSCKEKYELKGNKTQSCVGLDLSNIIVSCVKVCPQLYNPENGNVTVNEDRTFAKYKCQIGFSLRGSEMRECDDGAWTGTEAECVFELITAGENVKPIGANPSMGLGAGVFDIRSPDVLISRCNAIATFSFRTTTEKDEVDVTAMLVLLNNETIANTTVKIRSDEYSSDDPKPVCIPLVCSNTSSRTSGSSNGSHIIRVGTLVITVTVEDGSAEFSNVNFLEGETCDGPVNDTETGSCDNSTESGDCGYRNTGCGTGPFEVSLTSDSSDSQHGHEPIVPLMNDQASSSECPIFVCLPCLQKSGFSVSLRNKSETSPSSRKKRSFIKVQSGASKSFCLFPKSGGYLSNDFTTRKLDKHTKNKYMSFHHDLDKDGVHALVVFVRCTGKSHMVHVGKGSLIYEIPNYVNQGSSGQRCLDLHKYIDGQLPGNCKQFSVVFQGFAASKPLCISQIQFTDKTKTNFCRSLDNV